MIDLIKKLAGEMTEDATLTLPLASRVKSRLRAVLDDGRDVGLYLERGQVLQNGDLLASESGVIVKIVAADETVSTVSCDDAWLLARACYHLGNRHVALQINPGRIQYLHDHVLDDMLKGFGLTVNVEQAPFEPETGAYGSHVSNQHHH
ncbi:urease accessory protein UreE [uncultured Cycloclasticus sp.]|uniref:urease accessory protein UreE n=1 Tax=uncultured Cycloclasticus sp. TaxID=172194 RepID=UPI00258E9843|nr:urease accessory protein UreE [uncultured Cycloclasticus sp.]